MPERLLTVRVVADRLDVSTETVLRWCRRGQMPSIRLPGGAIRIQPADLEAWLLDRYRTAA
jgi:excisionase family DNA binding protein